MDIWEFTRIEQVESLTKLEFGELLKKARLRQQWSQLQLSQYAFFGDDKRSLISRLENGKQKPDRLTIDRLFAVLGGRLSDQHVYRQRPTLVDEGPFRPTISPKMDFVDSNAHAFVAKAKEHPNISSATLHHSATTIETAINTLINLSGHNDVPIELKAFQKLPFELTRIANLIPTGDFERLVRYISELESENARMAELLKQSSARKRLNLFLDEATKTAAGWQAWLAVIGSVTALFAYLELAPDNRLSDEIEQHLPEKPVQNSDTFDI